MSYYCGWAQVPFRNLPIRVKPENLDGNIVTELEIELFDTKSLGFGKIQKICRWEKRHRSQGHPPIFRIWVQIGWEQRDLVFKEEVPEDEVKIRRS